MKKFFLISAIAISLFSFNACEKSSSESSTVKIRMTDAPFDAEEVNIDLREIRIAHRNDSSWSSLQTNTGIYNLLQFQNGLDTVIATGTIPATSTIKDVRFILGPDNSIKINGIVYPLTIPSGSESGLKIKVNKKVNRSIEDILLDFDANLSIHRTGSNQYILKPVIKIK